MLRSSLRTFIGERATGFNGNLDQYSLYTQIGISSNDNRRIDFDRETFMRELNTNPNDVVRLFSADSEGTLDNNNFIYSTIATINQTQSGNHSFKVTYGDDGIISYVEYTDHTGTTYTSDQGSSGIMINRTNNNFTVFGGGARGVSIQGVGSGINPDMTYEINLTVRDGKAKSFENEIKRLFDENEGLTKVLERNYESIIKNIDKRIDRENARVLQIKKRLETRFANLEVNMQNWNGQMERLQQQLASLNN
jgi:flagellar hook-associated protein 2